MAEAEAPARVKAAAVAADDAETRATKSEAKTWAADTVLYIPTGTHWYGYLFI